MLHASCELHAQRVKETPQRGVSTEDAPQEQRCFHSDDTEPVPPPLREVKRALIRAKVPARYLMCRGITESCDVESQSCVMP